MLKQILIIIFLINGALTSHRNFHSSIHQHKINQINTQSINDFNSRKLILKQNDDSETTTQNFDLFKFIIEIVSEVSQSNTFNLTSECRQQLKIWNSLVFVKNESALSLCKYNIFLNYFSVYLYAT